MGSLELFWSLFGHVLTAIWFGLSVFAGVAGLWALLIPNSFVEFNRRLSTWIALGETPAGEDNGKYSLERPFYRFHLVTGPSILIAGLYVLYQAVLVLGSADIGRVLGSDASVSGMWVDILVDAAFGWIYISCAIAIVVGIIVTIRPSYLKGIEFRLNTWVDTENTTNKLDKRLNLLDEWVTSNPRIFGILSLSGSVLVAWAMMHFGYIA
jgi:hypothetical protein